MSKFNTYLLCDIKFHLKPIDLDINHWLCKACFDRKKAVQQINLKCDYSSVCDYVVLTLILWNSTNRLHFLGYLNTKFELVSLWEHKNANVTIEIEVLKIQQISCSEWRNVEKNQILDI